MSEKPQISLQTLATVIQLVESEIKKTAEELKQADSSNDGFIWLETLEKASIELESAYTEHIEKLQVLNFPSYEELIKKS